MSSQSPHLPGIAVDLPAVSNESLQIIRVDSLDEEVVRILANGEVEVGEGFSATAAAKQFWNAVRELAPVRIPHDALRADIYRAVLTQFPDRGLDLVHALEQQRQELLMLLEELYGYVNTTVSKITSERLAAIRATLDQRQRGG